jgi:phage-related protein
MDSEWSAGKPLVWLKGEIRTPPMSAKSRVQTGFLLRCLQDGEHLQMPLSRPMPSVGHRCHELRVRESNHNWRVVYRIDPDAIVILEVFDKTSRQTPQHIIRSCKDRLRRYDSIES